MRRGIAATGLAILLGAAAPQAVSGTSVVRTRGPVDVRQAGAWSDASRGDRLAAGDAARTGRQGFATLRDARGTVTELFPLALFEVPEETAFRALSGTIWTHFRKIPGLVREIRTPSAVALIRGTTLAVEASDSRTRIVVFEGLVEVRDLAGKSGLVPEGYAVRADREGLGPVERALATDLDEGRRFLDRVRDFVEPPSAGGAPGFHGGAGPGFPGVAPRGAERRPTAQERAEAAFERARAGEGLAGPPGAAARDRSGGPGAVAGDRRFADPTVRAEGGIGPILGSEIRVDAGPGRDPASRVEDRPGAAVGAEIRLDAGRPGDPAGRTPSGADPAARAEIRVDAGKGAPDQADQRKDQRPIEIDVRTRTDLPADILKK